MAKFVNSFSFPSIFITVVIGWLFSFSAVAIEPEPICAEDFYRLVTNNYLPRDASLGEIKAGFKKLREGRQSLFAPEIDSRRLVNEEDWMRNTEERRPWYNYGITTIKDWHRALRFTQNLPRETPLTVDLLRTVHLFAAGSMPFHGFEGRRIRRLFDEKKITEAEFKALLKRAYEGNEEVSGVSHKSLRGQLRSEPIDEIWHAGSSRAPGIGRYFDGHELDVFRHNPYMRVDETHLKNVGPDMWDGRVYYSPVKDIQKNLQRVIDDTNSVLASPASDEKKLQAIAQMEKHMVSIHPFLDGNGRSIRLVGDLLRDRLGFPPPLFPNENDLTMAPAEAWDFQRHGMIEYLNAWNGRLK